MQELIGTTFWYGKTQYIIDKVDEFGPELKGLIALAKEHGKDPAMYFASKVLKSGKKSKQGGAFYRFTSGDFIKI